MAADTFVESGMIFGPFPEGHCYRIELSDLYRRIGSGVKIAEFLLLREIKDKVPTVWIVEAKSSSPKPGSIPNFDSYIEELREKLTNALILFAAAVLQRHNASADDLPVVFRDLDPATVKVRFVLVVNGHKEEWTPPLQDALSKALQSIVKTSGLSPNSVAVISNTKAESEDLISGYESTA